MQRLNKTLINPNQQLHNEFLQAVKDGKLERVKTLFPKVTNIHCRTSYGETPLHLAARGGHLAIAQFLLDNGANINSVNPKGGVVMLIAASNGSASDETVNKIETSNKNGAGETPLHVAIEGQHLNMVNLLLTRGADTEISNYYWRTPLFYALTLKNEEIFAALLEHGADPKALQHDSFRCTLLHEAVEDDDPKTVKIIQLLLRHGAEVDNMHGMFHKGTPLHIGAYYNSINAMEQLLQHGAQINLADDKGNTALLNALNSRNPQIETVRFLLNHGAKVECANKKGQNPLHLAVATKNIKIINLLLEAGASRTQRDGNGLVPLDYCQYETWEDLLNSDSTLASIREMCRMM